MAGKHKAIDLATKVEIITAVEAGSETKSAIANVLPVPESRYDISKLL